MTKEAVTIEGTLKTFSSLGGSGNPILRHFYPECGSSIAEARRLLWQGAIVGVAG